MNYVIHLRKDVLLMDLVVFQLFNVKMYKQKKLVKVKILVHTLGIAEIYKQNAVHLNPNLFVLILLLVLQ